MIPRVLMMQNSPSHPASQGQGWRQGRTRCWPWEPFLPCNQTGTHLLPKYPLDQSTLTIIITRTQSGSVLNNSIIMLQICSACSHLTWVGARFGHSSYIMTPIYNILLTPIFDGKVLGENFLTIWYKIYTELFFLPLVICPLTVSVYQQQLQSWHFD